MMRPAHTMAALVIAVTVPGRALAETPANLLNLWVSERYADAAVAAIAHTERHGRSLEVDYIIGTSACRVREYRAYGLKYLDITLRDYANKLGPKRRTVISIEKGKCEPAWGPSVTAYYKKVPATSHWIGVEGAPWNPRGAESAMDTEGEDVDRLFGAAFFSTHTVEALRREAANLPPPADVEVAPCGPDCSVWGPP